MDVLQQRDFSGGEISNVAADLIPANGFYSAINALLDDDGSVFMRGGTSYYSTSDASGTLKFVWNGDLGPGNRTVYATSSAFGVLDGSNAPTSLTTSFAARADACSGIGLMFSLGGQSDPAGSVTVYGGSRKASNYSTGTIATTVGSKTVTGTGTSFSANVDAGMILLDGVGGNFLGVVASVDSNTQVTLVDQCYTTLAGHAYDLVNVHSYTPFGSVTLTAIAFMGGRLIGATGSEVRFLPAYDYTTGAGPFSAWNTTDFHKLTSASVVAMRPCQDTLMVFTTHGIYGISNIALDLTDPAGNEQQRVSHLNEEIVAVGSGIAPWNGGLIVPARDNIYFVTESSAPQSLAGAIRRDYQTNLASGVAAGTVYNAHYLLSVKPLSVLYQQTKVLNLRSGAWTSWTGSAMPSLSMCTTTGSPSKPLAVSAARVIDLSTCWPPSASSGKDHDSVPPGFVLITRTIPLDAWRKALLKKVRVTYEMADASPSSSPVLDLYYVVDGFNHNTFTLQSSSPGVATPSSEPATWSIQNGGTGVRSRTVCLKFVVSAACVGLKIHGIEYLFRRGGRQ